MTIVFNVPLNTPESAERAAVWTRYLWAWTASNHVRTVASLAAAASFIMALRELSASLLNRISLIF